jgi:hypothetical protein
MTGPAIWVIVWLVFWVWQPAPMLLWGAGLGLVALAGSAMLTYGGFWSPRQAAEARSLQAVLSGIVSRRPPPEGTA